MHILDPRAMALDHVSRIVHRNREVVWWVRHVPIIPNVQLSVQFSFSLYRSLSFSLSFSLCLSLSVFLDLYFSLRISLYAYISVYIYIYIYICKDVSLIPLSQSFSLCRSLSLSIPLCICLIVTTLLAQGYERCASACVRGTALRQYLLQYGST